MSVRQLGANVIGLAGDCGVDDAESLQRHLLASPAAVIDWRECSMAHTAVIQVMLAAGQPVVGPPRNIFLETFVGRSFGRVAD